MSDISHDIKLENPLTKTHQNTSTQSMTQDIQIKMPQKKQSKFRRVTAKWKTHRNRSLHSKFVKTSQNIPKPSATKHFSPPKNKRIAKNKIFQQQKDLTTRKSKGKPNYASGKLQH